MQPSIDEDLVRKGITRFLLQNVQIHEAGYLCDGLKLKFQSLRESQLINTDLAIKELWMQIKRVGFDDAVKHLEDWKAHNIEYPEGIAAVDLQLEKLKMVLDSPTEEL